MSVRAQLWTTLLYIGIGGALGASSRYFVAVSIKVEGFPFETLLVNLLGCFLLSFLATKTAIKTQLSSNFILLFNTGFIGSFTTFSTFAVEVIHLWEIGYILTFIYIISTIFGGIVLAYFGFCLAKKGKEIIS